MRDGPTGRVVNEIARLDDGRVVIVIDDIVRDARKTAGAGPAGRHPEAAVYLSPQGAEHSPAPVATAEPETQAVRVWLYGALSLLCPERPLVIDFPRGITVGEMIDILCHHVGFALRDGVMETPTRKSNICRVFFNGTLVGLEDRLPDTAGGPADFEMIVLTASEGG